MVEEEEVWKEDSGAERETRTPRPALDPRDTGGMGCEEGVAADGMGGRGVQGMQGVCLGGRQGLQGRKWKRLKRKARQGECRGEGVEGRGGWKCGRGGGRQRCRGGVGAGMKIGLQSAAVPAGTRRQPAAREPGG